MSVTHLLFPGRHHLVTRFQTEHLAALANAHPGATVVWAITSADHAGTQRNPLPGWRRLGLIEAVAEAEGLDSLTFQITNRSPKRDFAHYVIEEIRTQTGGRVAMTPENTIVVCSTPAVIADYEALGYAIDTIELGLDVDRPWQLVERIAEVGDAWAEDGRLAEALHPVARAHYLRYGLADTLRDVFADPLVDSDDGDITATRDYATYRKAFEDNAWRKVEQFARFVRPGRIVDVGCATGQTIKLLADRPELFESDFYGVEVARPLYEICQQRKANGEFGDANVFFHQRNVMMTELFTPGSIDTVITMALTHEIESYLGRDELHRFADRSRRMLRADGVWINLDVAGPDGGDDLVHVRFTQTDGDDRDPVEQPTQPEILAMNSLSRFRQFAHDFRRAEGDQITYAERPDGLITLRRDALYEFLAKKDYADSWLSEMHERFCFFSPSGWATYLRGQGFDVEVHPIRNQWLIENRFAPAATVYREVDGRLVEDDWSWTNVLLVATPRLEQADGADDVGQDQDDAADQ